MPALASGLRLSLLERLSLLIPRQPPYLGMFWLCVSRLALALCISHATLNFLTDSTDLGMLWRRAPRPPCRKPCWPGPQSPAWAGKLGSYDAAMML